MRNCLTNKLLHILVFSTTSCAKHSLWNTLLLQRFHHLGIAVQDIQGFGPELVAFFFSLHSFVFIATQDMPYLLSSSFQPILFLLCSNKPVPIRILVSDAYEIQFHPPREHTQFYFLHLCLFLVHVIINHPKVHEM
jgi:hypothetical protein